MWITHCLIFLCLLCCSPSGEKRVLEQKSSEDINGYQIRVWKASHKVPHTCFMGPVIYFSFSTHWPIHIGNAEWVTSNFSCRNKCLIQLPFICVVRGVSWSGTVDSKWPSNVQKLYTVFKKNKIKLRGLNVFLITAARIFAGTGHKKYHSV